MTLITRYSPIHSQLQPFGGEWRDLQGMASLIALPTDSQYRSQLGLVDLSAYPRCGVKGAGAAHWLAEQGLPIPDRPNTWLPLAAGGLIARLGRSEFLIEDSESSAIVPPLRQASESPPPQVYPVLRQDLALGLIGDQLPALLRQTCSFNFQALTLADRPVVIASLIGVGVTVIPTTRHGLPACQIWCDGSFGVYVWQTLLAIAVELGGGVIGMAGWSGGEGMKG